MNVKVRTYTREQERANMDVLRSEFMYTKADPAHNAWNPRDTDGTGDMGPSSTTKALPFREELKNALVALLDELQVKAIAQVETKGYDTHATPHVRTAAGVRKFRQALGTVIKRDIIPPTLNVDIGTVDATPKGDAAEKTTKALAAHVQERVIKAMEEASDDDDPDVALKKLANRELHGPILEKLRATEAGRKWLAEHKVVEQASLEWIFGDQTGAEVRKRVRKRLIDLDPTSKDRTAAENQERADRLINYLRSEDPWLTEEFGKAGSEDAKYGEALIRSLFIGTKATDTYGLQWYLTPGDIALVARAREHVDTIDPDLATVGQWTRKCIDTWANTAFDTNSLSIAMQATAETLYGGDSLITRFPHVAEKQTADQKKLAKKVDTLITENAPFLAAFVSAVYERSQETLKTLPGDKVRVWRGMQISPEMMKRKGEGIRGVATQDDIDEFAKTGWKPWLAAWAMHTPIDKQLSVLHDVDANWNHARTLLQEQAFYEWYEQKYGVEPMSMTGQRGEYDASVVLQPLSATAATPHVAQNFTTTYGSGTPDDGVSSMFTMDVPKERIWSIPTHGPGCLEEDEIIVLGGEYTAHVKEQSSTYGGDIHYMIDDKFRNDGSMESIVTENVRDLLTRELRNTKGDQRASANLRMYDLVGKSVAETNEVGIFNGKDSWDWYDEISSEMYDLDMRWYYTMRAIGFSKNDAKEMAKAVDKRKSKQRYTKPKPVTHAPAKKLPPAKKIPGQIGASFMPTRSRFPTHKKPVHKVPAKNPWKKKTAKKLVKKPVFKKAYIDKLPNPETISYDAMVAAVYAENPKYMTVYPPDDGKGASPEQWFHIDLFQMALDFDKQGIKPKTKVTKAFIDKWKAKGLEFDGSQWYVPDTWFPDQDLTKEPKFPAGLEAAMRDRGYVWHSDSMMFVIPYTPAMKKKLPKEMLGKPKVKKPAPTKMAGQVPPKTAKKPKAQVLFELGVDSNGKPKALNQYYGWHKQPDGSYKNKYDAYKPPSALITAMEMHGWTYDESTKTFHQPGLPPKKKAAHKKLVPKSKKAVKK